MNELRNDKNLREAVGRREQQLPPLPADLNERVIRSLSPRQPYPLSPSPRGEGERLRQERELKRRWESFTIAAAAAGIALLLVFHFGKQPSAQEPAVAQQLAVAPEPAVTQEIAVAQQPAVPLEPAVAQQPAAKPVPNQPQPMTQQGSLSSRRRSPSPLGEGDRGRGWQGERLPPLDDASSQDEIFMASTSDVIIRKTHGDALTSRRHDSEDDVLLLPNDKDWKEEGWADLRNWKNDRKVSRVKSKKEIRLQAIADAVSKAVAAKQWRIDISSMTPMRYGSRTVTPDFFLELRGDTLHSYLPYLGQAQVSPMLSPSIGLNFEEPLLSYKESELKKYKQIDIDVKTREDSYHYVIEIYDSGEATIRVRSLNRDPISFDGTLVTTN